MALQPGAHARGFLELSPGGSHLDSVIRLQKTGYASLKAMTERPDPDIDRVRRAMRDHDEREEQDERADQDERDREEQEEDERGED
jgi:hypothetical protein